MSAAGAKRKTKEIYVIYRLDFLNNGSAESEKQISERSEWKYEFDAPNAHPRAEHRTQIRQKNNGTSI